jgi:hypothetical protein
VSIVVSFDVSKQGLPRVGMACPTALMDQFDFEGVKEALHRGIIIAVTVRQAGPFPNDPRLVSDLKIAPPPPLSLNNFGARHRSAKEAGGSATRWIDGTYT